MFIDDYKEYLRKNGKTESCVLIFSLKIREFLASGYSEEELCDELDMLITQHRRGGMYYDVNDKGLSLSALKELRKFLLEPYVEKFYISYKAGWLGLEETDDYPESYEISRGILTVFYKKYPGKEQRTECVTLPENSMYVLIGLLKRNQKYLSPSDTEIKGTLGFMSRYEYVFGDKRGQACQSLFTNPEANADFKMWVGNYIKNSDSDDIEIPFGEGDCMPIDGDDDIPF